MSAHEGHRERMKRRFAEHGLDNFSDVNVLELLLFYARPRCDTNLQAHALLERFGSLDAVLEAPLGELEKVEGVGWSSAVLLKLIPQVSRRYLMAKDRDGDRINSTEQAGRYCVPLFMYEREEVIYLICLDGKSRVVCCREMSRGVVNTAEITVRRIVEQALASNASRVILTHNHVDGLAIPSREDEVSTRRVREALHMVGVALLDHIIVARDDYVSMADSGLL